MEKHPYFDLWLYTTQELNEILSAEVLERKMLHDWPLSCVQVLRLADGRKLIYKSQERRSTVEPEFYASAQTPLLPKYWNLGERNRCANMVFEFVDAPRLDDQNLNQADLRDHRRRLTELIAQIGGDPPVYTDVSTPSHWRQLADETLATLKALIGSRTFLITTNQQVLKLADWCRSEAVLAAIQSGSGITHGDLTPENIFVTSGGYRLIDWQRPRRAPVAIDEITLLEALGKDPLEWFNPAMVGLHWFLLLQWLVTCKTTFFPQGEVYDAQVAGLIDKIHELGSN